MRACMIILNLTVYVVLFWCGTPRATDEIRWNPEAGRGVLKRRAGSGPVRSRTWRMGGGVDVVLTTPCLRSSVQFDLFRDLPAGRFYILLAST
jgi:hypothetical protein